MNRLILCCLCFALLNLSLDAHAVKNDFGKWALHYAGPHDPQGNTCSFQLFDLMNVDVDAPVGSGHYDIYVLAVDVVAIAQSEFGLQCDGAFLFYGWTSCSDSGSPTAGWPDCGEGIILNWASEQPGPHVTMGILDFYVYGPTSVLCASVHPTVGQAGWCDGTVPDPICTYTTAICAFGCVGFGQPGYNPMECNPVSVEQGTWGAVKALYR